MNKQLFLLILFFTGTTTYSQYISSQQYNDNIIWNRKNVNPAFAGESKDWTVHSHYINQWGGMDGAPYSMSLSCEKYFSKIKSSFGIENSYSSIAILRNESFKTYYNYRHGFNENIMLGIGTSLGMLKYTLDFSDIRSTNENDPLLSIPPSEVAYHTLLNAGSQLRVWNHTLGFSYNEIVQGSTSPNLTCHYRNIFLSYSYKIKLGNVFVSTPQLFYKRQFEYYDTFLSGTTGAVIDFAVKHYVNFGVLYASNKNLTSSSETYAFYITALFGRLIRVGYAYSGINSNYINFGSHSIIMGVMIGKNKEQL